MRHSHEQASLPASTVTNNDQLATDLRHLRNPKFAFLDAERLFNVERRSAVGGSGGLEMVWVVYRQRWSGRFIRERSHEGLCVEPFR